VPLELRLRKGGAGCPKPTSPAEGRDASRDHRPPVAGRPIFLDETGITTNIRWVPAIATCRRSFPSLNQLDGNP